MKESNVVTGKVLQLAGAQQLRLDEYLSRLSRSSNKQIFDERVRNLLVQYARDPELVREVNNYGNSIGYTQSSYDPDQMMDQVKRFAVKHDVKPRAWMRSFKRAKARLVKQFRKWRLKAMRFSSGEDIIAALSTVATHSGSEYLYTGLRKKQDFTVDETFQLFELAISEIVTTGAIKNVIMLGSRSQASGAYDEFGNETGTFNAKTRLVSMIAYRLIMVELMFAKPLQMAMGQKNALFYAGGLSDNDIRLTMNRWRVEHDKWYSLDYSKYDQSIPAWLIYEAFDVCKSAFGELSEQEEIVWNAMMHAFVHKVFITPDGLIEAHDGVPSGSMFTQIIDTVVNMLMIYCYLYSKDIDERHIDYDFEMMIMGDDNIMFCRYFHLDMVDLAQYLLYNFGIEVNVSKSSEGTSSDYPEFLSREWRPKGAWKDPKVVILKLLWPERFRKYEELGMKPELVIVSYILSFPLAMEELINVRRFKLDFGLDLDKVELGEEYWTGSTRYRNVYLEGGIKTMAS